MKQAAKKLSIAFLFDDTLDSSDGVAQYVKTIGTWLVNQGHSVDYLVGQSTSKTYNGSPVYSLSKNMRISWGGNRLSIPILPDFHNIKSLLKSKSYDIVHVQVPYSPLMAKQVINRLPPSTALVGTFHVFPGNRLTELGSRALKIAYGKSLSRFDSHISVSSAAQSYALKSFAISSTIIPNAVEVAKFESANKMVKKPKTKRIVFLGRLVDRKGCRYLIRAFAQVKNSHPSTSLIIAGDGPQKSALENLVSKSGLGGSVEFLGFIKEDQKAGLFASADIACFPSLYGESFGIVLIEAMAAGAGVVVGGNNPGYKSTLDGNQDVLLDPTDIEKFSMKLTTLLTDKDLFYKIHGLQQSAVKKYDVNVVGRQIVSAYSEVIAKRLDGGHN